MTTPGPAPLHTAVLDAWPVALQRRFEAVAFDGDGTAVPDRRADASPVRRQIEQLTSLGVDVGVISGTHVENIDGQLQARPAGPGHLYLCVNRGSEIYEADSTGIHLVDRRTELSTRQLQAEYFYRWQSWRDVLRVFKDKGEFNEN